MSLSEPAFCNGSTAIDLGLAESKAGTMGCLARERMRATTIATITPLTIAVICGKRLFRGVGSLTVENARESVSRFRRCRSARISEACW